MPSRRVTVLIVLTIVFAASRYQAIARTLWDWDEALFALSVLDYDVAAHQPHPPGYPLFVGAAKLLHAAGLHEFSALQAIAVASAMLLFPIAWLLATELGFTFRAAVAGASLFVVLPNVWLYGGTAFSDIPATAVTLLAAALLLRGRTDCRAYLVGAALAGIAMGIRTASVLVIAAPALVATWTRLRSFHDARRRELVTTAGALLIAAVIVIASYAGAALASDSVENYRWAVQVQSDWVRQVDSFLSPQRPNLIEVAKLFFVLPVQEKDLMFPIAALALLGAIQAFARRRSHALMTIATFLPLMLFSWLMLDLNSVSRYAIPYLPMHAFLAAEALDFLAEPAARWRRWLPSLLYGSVATAGVVAMALWVWPSLKVQRKKASPPYSAMTWVRHNVPDGSPLFITRSFEPHARYLLGGRSYKLFDDARELERVPSNSFVIDQRARPDALNFVRRKERLWKSMRARYFEASVLSLSNYLRFGSGWYRKESEGRTEFRWMGREGLIYLPRVSQPTELRIVFSVPDAAPKPIAVKILFNGNLIDELAVRSHSVERRWVLESVPSGENELRLVTGTALMPAARGISPDRRTLGLRLESLEWMPRRR